MPMHDWTRVDPNDYHHFHVGWIAAISYALNNGVLPDGYYALAEHTAPPIVPDVLTLRAPDTPTQRPRKPSRGSGGDAAVAAPPVRYTATAAVKPTTPARRRVAVRHARGRELVAVIEIVSPSNKANRREFRDLVDKSVQLITQGISLLVIDPFPPTARDPHGLHTAVWKAATRLSFDPPADKPLTLASYAAAGGECTAFVEPLAVGDRLRDMPLFLRPDLWVAIPLEATYRVAWDGFPKPLRPLLTGTEAARG